MSNLDLEKLISQIKARSRTILYFPDDDDTFNAIVQGTAISVEDLNTFKTRARSELRACRNDTEYRVTMSKVIKDLKSPQPQDRIIILQRLYQKVLQYST